MSNKDDENKKDDEIIESFNNGENLSAQQDRPLTSDFTQAELLFLSSCLTKKDFEALVYRDTELLPAEKPIFFRTVVSTIRDRKVPASILGKCDLKRILRGKFPSEEAWEDYLDAQFEEIWNGDFKYTSHFANTCSDAFEKFLEECQGTFDVKVKLFKFRKLPKRSASIINQTIGSDKVEILFDEYLTDLHGSKHKPFKNQNDRFAAIEIYILKTILEEMDKVKKILEYNPETANSDKKHFDYFLKAFYGENIPIALKWGWEQWFRNIKIKITYGPNHPEYKVTNHVIPFIKSSQGAGKSFAIEKVLRPLMDFVLLAPDPSVLFSEKYGMTFEQNFIHWIDETDKYKQEDIANVKTYSTSNFLSVRTYHTQSVSSVPNRSSFIMLSNHDFTTIIKDPTGIRRFVPSEIQWKSILNPKTGVEIKKQIIDREFIEKLDPIKLFRGFDPKMKTKWDLLKVDPEVTEIIEAFQEPHKTVDIIEEFYKDCMVFTTDKTEASTITAIYQAYIKYIELNGSKSSFTKHTFSKRLESIIKQDKNRAVDDLDVKIRSSKGTVFPFKIITPYESDEVKKKEYEDSLKDIQDTPTQN